MEYSDITCPVCGLACDDLRVTVENEKVRVHDLPCRTVEGFFTSAWPTDSESITPEIKGKSASFDDAITQAGKLLANANAPVVSGLMTDVQGARAALALADRIGACVDHSASHVMFRNLRVVQDSGWFTTTLSEVRNRADLIVIVGENVFEQFPRFAERVLTADGLFISAKRKIVLIGSWHVDKLPPELAHADVTVIDLPLTNTAEATGLLRTLLNSDMQPVVSSLPLDSLSQLASWLNEAAYSVIAWSSADFDFPHAELAVESLSELVRDLNQTKRSAGLPLGGGNGSMSANQVCTWQAGFPLRTSFACKHPDHDAWRYDSARMMREQEADLLVWIATLSPDPVPATDCPQIVIGHPGIKFDKPPEVYFPAAIPGIDQAGHCFRTDGVVALPLRKLREPRWPTTQHIIDQLLESAC